MKLLALALLLIPAFCMATAQFPERLEIKGKEYSLHTRPLGTYMWVYGIDFDFQEAFEQGDNSGCWRGYIGHWEIKDRKLYLKKITSPLGEKNLPLSALFTAADEAGIFCDWFSGYLSYASGKLLYRSRSYAEAFERWEILKIDSGVVVEKISRSGHAEALQLILNESWGPKISVTYEDKNFREAFLLLVAALSETLKTEESWPALDDWLIQVELPNNLEERKHSLTLRDLDFGRAADIMSELYEVNFSTRQSNDTVVIKVNEVKPNGVVNDGAAPHRD